MAIKITVIYDNNLVDERLQKDWGFSALIECGDKNILFDTGEDGRILLNNMEKLGILPQIIDIVFISHADHDHVNGLPALLDMNPNVQVIFPKSFPPELVDMIQSAGALCIPVSSELEIMAGVYSLGELICEKPEQSLAIRTPEGLVVITGCAHPGIITILEKVQELFPQERISLLFGGFHLYRDQPEKILETAAKLIDKDIIKIAPAHCTGLEAQTVLKDVFQDYYIGIGAGKIINIPE